MEQQKLLAARTKFLALVAADMAVIQKEYAVTLGDVKAIDCVLAGMDPENETRVVYTFRHQCPDLKELRNAIRESIDNNAVEAGLSGTTFKY